MIFKILFFKKLNLFNFLLTSSSVSPTEDSHKIELFALWPHVTIFVNILFQS